MKNIFYVSIIAVLVSFVVSQNATDIYAKADLESIVADTNTVAKDTNSDLTAHDIVIKGRLRRKVDKIRADIAVHDTDVKTKLDEILAAVQNGGDGSVALVPNTGQPNLGSGYYDEQADAYFQRGVAWPNPRFTDNGNGTITDNLTKLIWDKNANRFGKQFWTLAIQSCSELADNGGDLTDGSVAGDWFLPNLRELHSIVHYGVLDPAVPDTHGTGKWGQGDPFNNVQSQKYFTSSRDMKWPIFQAWVIDLYDGSFYSTENPENEEIAQSGVLNHCVWCVRGGQ